MLTANHHYTLDGLRPGSPLSTARTRLKLTHGYDIGLNTWYLAAGRDATGALKVRDGIIHEIGIADPALTHTAAQQRTFLHHL
jgi:hypothetical protein